MLSATELLLKDKIEGNKYVEIMLVLTTFRTNFNSETQSYFHYAIEETITCDIFPFTMCRNQRIIQIPWNISYAFKVSLYCWRNINEGAC